MRGLSVPSTHTYMIRTLQKLYFAAKQRFKLSTLKVGGHTGNPGNDKADELADWGVNHQTRIGRHSETPARPVTIPPRPLDPQWLAPLSLSQQTSHLLQSIKTASQAELPKQPLIQRKSYISPETWKKSPITTKTLLHTTTGREQLPQNKSKKMQGKTKQNTPLKHS